MRSTLISTALAATLVLAACSSDGDGESDAEDDAAPADTSTDTQTTGDDTAESGEGDAPDSAPGSDPATETEPPPPEPGEGTATLTLGNGETFEVDVLCTLEPQISAGSEILFTATSLGDPLLDITQFGDEGPVGDVGTVTLVDGSTIEPLWGASTSYEPFGGSLELTLEGSTIRGTGDFYPGDDPVDGGDPVEGEVVAEC